jgi:hypothetical protein
LESTNPTDAYLFESVGSCQINKQQRNDAADGEWDRLLLSFGLGRGDVFLGYVSVRPRAAQVEKLEFEESDHLDFRRETPSLEHSFVAVIAFLVFIVVTSVGIQLSFVGIGRTRNN